MVFLQKQLAVLGYTVGNIDGIFGVKTLEAARAFQAWELPGYGRRSALSGGTVTLRSHRNLKRNLGKEG